ncbi:enolase C-terminal domain-like protein [Leifsonia shinshuensis]|uniref:enolase C-terminal domain-like protein n=1 Tax=Leifsonia shinshuensis TaxID=150026 RepID=UPI00285CE610|nr:enolase C-terminal domain-like protein [Leifsonia shinshuensis]MDR6971968.1 L-alanine-DL-glutamate epimerase-like enolase superfamily enzyme [Leifsonia shinshuensis]
MKITHVEAFRVAVPPADPPFRWRDGLSGSPATGDGAVLRIGTDAGAEGVAFLSRPGAWAVLSYLAENVFRPELLGADPLQREWLWHRVWELDRIHELPLYVLGLVDTALWDLAGRVQGEPVWRLLGGFRTEIPAYASTSTFADIPEFLDVADQALALGYRGVKLHAWGDARRDAELALALREHVGDAVPLMYDGSAGFDLPDAIRLGDALADAGYLWYEEPMREFSVGAYAALARSVRISLLVGETSDGAHFDSADFIRAGAATFGVRTSTNLRGGITGAMRTAHLADSFLLRAEVHGSDIPTHHLCMAISNTTYYESLVTSHPVRREPAVDADGMLHAPTTPGIALPAGLEYPADLERFAA